MKAKLSTCLVFFALIFTAPIFSQNSFDAIEDVILLNNKPYVVRMALDGEILSFVKDLKDNYSSINSVKRKEIMLKDVIEVDNDDSDIAEENADVNENSEEEITTKGTGIKNVKYDYDFAFDHRDARLSILTVSRLKQIADIMKNNKDVKFYINSYFSENVDVSKILSKNRTKAISELLKSRGIHPSRIDITQTNHDDWANNRVKASLY